MTIIKINEQIKHAENYRIVRATPENIAHVLKTILKLPEGYMPHVLPAIRNGEPWVIKQWLKVLRMVREDAAVQKKWMERGFHEIVRVRQYANLVPSVLRNAQAAQYAGDDVAPTFKFNYIALGDSVTAPTNADTQLGNETLRGLFSDRYAIDNVAYLDKFFTTAQVANLTFKEAGCFVDGEAGADTGYLGSHVAIDESQGANETLTFNVSITVA